MPYGISVLTIKVWFVCLNITIKLQLKSSSNPVQPDVYKVAKYPEKHFCTSLSWQRHCLKKCKLSVELTAASKHHPEWGCWPQRKESTDFDKEGRVSG